MGSRRSSHRRRLGGGEAARVERDREVECRIMGMGSRGSKVWGWGTVRGPEVGVRTIRRRMSLSLVLGGKME